MGPRRSRAAAAPARRRRRAAGAAAQAAAAAAAAAGPAARCAHCVPLAGGVRTCGAWEQQRPRGQQLEPGGTSQQQWRQRWQPGRRPAGSAARLSSGLRPRIPPALCALLPTSAAAGAPRVRGGRPAVRWGAVVEADTGRPLQRLAFCCVVQAHKAGRLMLTERLHFLVFAARPALTPLSPPTSTRSLPARPGLRRCRLPRRRLPSAGALRGAAAGWRGGRSRARLQGGAAAEARLGLWWWWRGEV